VTLASGRDGDGDALPIRAHARVLGATVKAGETVEYALDKGRHAYLVPAVGSIKVNGVPVNARDGAAIRDESRIAITALADAEVVLVDSV
jgi:redox-sensitive bicupin YhaK (pirin superfamily)